MPRAAGEVLYIILMHQSRTIRAKQVSTTALGSPAAEHPMGSGENELRKYTEWKSGAVKAWRRNSVSVKRGFKCRFALPVQVVATNRKREVEVA